MLSDVALGILEAYVEDYKPQNWLFPEQMKERHITVRTVQKIIGTQEQ